MKIFKKIFTAVASLAMVAAPVVASGVVGAAPTPVKPTAPDNTKVVITKQVKNVTNPVTNTFSFTVAADGNNPATVTGYTTSFTIPFSNVAPDAGTKIAEQTYELDFSNVEFPKVGDYYFKITETTTGTATAPATTWSTNTDNIYPIDADEWYAYVSVRYVTDNNPNAVSGTPTSTMKATVAPMGVNATEKSTNIPVNDDTSVTPTVRGNKDDIVFETTPAMTYIQIEKKVTGNLADIDEYFEYTVDFSDHGALMQNKTITLVGDFADHVAGCTGITANATSPKNVTTDATGKVKLCMKHNQVVKVGLTAATNGVGQIPLKKTDTVNYKYTLTETPKTKLTTNTPQTTVNEYKIFIDGSTTESTTGEVEKTLAAIPADITATTAADTIAFNANNVTKYVNNKEADPITGFFINYWPFMLLVATGLTGFFVVKRTSKRN